MDLLVIYQPRKGKTFLVERAVRVTLVHCMGDYRVICSIPCLCQSDWGLWRVVQRLGETKIENVIPHIHIPRYVWGHGIYDHSHDKDRLN